MELEAKAVTPETREVKEAFDQFMNGFAIFKQENDLRLAELERRGGDVLQDDKVERISQALTEQKRSLDQLMLAASRPQLGGDRKDDFRAVEKKQAFDRYARKGDAGGMDGMEVKALSEGSNPDGGYTVPLEIERTIDRVLTNASPIRAIATVRSIGSSVYRKPITTAGAASGWVGETGSITTTAAPTLAALDFPAMELYAMPAATQALLDDSQVDIEQWLADEVQIVFAEQEGAAFVNGDGSNKPKGFLHYTNVAASREKFDRMISYFIASTAAANPIFFVVTIAEILLLLPCVKLMKAMGRPSWSIPTIAQRLTVSVEDQFSNLEELFSRVDTA